MPNVDWKKFVGGYALVDIGDAPDGEVLHGTISTITFDESGKLHISFVRLASLETIGDKTSWRWVPAEKLGYTIHSAEICETTDSPETMQLLGKNSANKRCRVYLFTPRHSEQDRFDWSQVTE